MVQPEVRKAHRGGSAELAIAADQDAPTRRGLREQSIR
jgi:hypothetical protein